MRACVLLIAVCLWMAVEAAVISRTDPCYITPETLKAAVRDTAKWRALCEESMFNSAACSNYWADVGEVKYLSAKFQRCLENTAALFRAWVYGDRDAAIPGAFVYQGVLDRVAASKMQAALMDIAESTYERTLNISTTLYQSNLQLFNSAVNNDASQSMKEMDVQSAAIQTRVRNEAQITRGVVDANHTDTRTFVYQSDSTDRVTEVNAALSDRSVETSVYTTIITNNANEGSNTRAEEVQQSVNTRVLVSSESNVTRATEISQSSTTRSFHSSSLNTTETLLKQEINSQEKQTRDTSALESQSTRSVVDSQSQTTQSTVTSEESVTVLKITSAIHNSTTATNTQVQTSGSSERSTVVAQQTAIRDTLATTTQKTQTAETSSGASVRSFVSSDLADVNATVFAAASSARNHFANTAAPQITAALSGVVPILGNQSNFMMSVMMHFNLANIACFWRRQSNVDLFLRPEDPNYFLSLQGVVNATVAYNVQRYGQSNCGNAVSYLNSGHAQARAQNFRTALSWYRAAYKDATLARNM